MPIKLKDLLNEQLSPIIMTKFNPFVNTASKLAKKYIDNKESNDQLNNFATKYQNESNFLYVSGKYQKLFLIKKGNIEQEYIISTGAMGFGNQPGSGKTPIGRLTVTKKVGGGLPDNTWLVGLKPIKKDGKYVQLPQCDTETEKKIKLIYRRIPNIFKTIVPGDMKNWLESIEKCEAHVLTRALVIDMSRGIYIHGTNRESVLGTPLSGGCIRMANDDVKELYNIIPIGTPIYINPSA